MSVFVHQGKTKDVYRISEHELKLVFSDRVTKNAAGQVDPGGNEVSEALLPGNGKACLTMTSAIFSYLAKHGIKTHMLSYDLDSNSMRVRAAKPFGSGLEFIARWVGTGSFVRRYKNLPSVRDGMRFASPVHEITIKDDAGQDPMITPSGIVALGLMSEGDMERLQQLNASAMGIIHKLFASKGLDLWDIKIEWGFALDNNELLLIDEVSSGCCRAFDHSTGKKLGGMELAQRFQ